MLRTRPGTLLQRFSDVEARRLCQAFVQDPGNATASRGWRTTAALVLSGLVLAGYAAVLLAGLWWARQAVGAAPLHPAQAVVWGLPATVCLGFCWLARPRFGRRGEQVLTPQQAPALHALISELAAQMQAPRPQLLRIDGTVNASVTKEGFPPRFTLTTGLPMLYGLTPQERVFVLAHELAHEVSGDPARSRWTHSAMQVLHTVQVLLYPDDSSHMGLAGQVVNGLRWLLTLPVQGLMWLFGVLLGEESQRAEFRADLLAARVSGSEAAVSALDKLHFAHLLEHALHKQRVDPERPHAFLELRHVWDHLSSEQYRRQREQVSRQRLRLDRSHPPTADRMTVMQAHPRAAEFTLTPERALHIEAELTPVVRALEEEAQDAFRAQYSRY